MGNFMKEKLIPKTKALTNKDLKVQAICEAIAQHIKGIQAELAGAPRMVESLTYEGCDIDDFAEYDYFVG